jgi:hypothetical protein
LEGAVGGVDREKGRLEFGVTGSGVLTEEQGALEVAAGRLVLADANAYPGMLDAFRDTLIWPRLVFFLSAGLGVTGRAFRQV